jgi:hypothetical protein
MFDFGDGQIGLSIKEPTDKVERELIVFTKDILSFCELIEE